MSEIKLSTMDTVRVIENSVTYLRINSFEGAIVSTAVYYLRSTINRFTLLSCKNY